jgi:putative ABC transport system substrate-binding protein
VFHDPANPAGSAEYAAMQAVSQSLGVDVSPIDSRRDPEEIERAIRTLAHSGNAGLVVTPSGAVSVQREMLVELTSQNKLPTVYPFSYMVTGGGLMSLGPNLVDQCRRAADYVDRILKGERPGELPVQAPTKYEMAINLKTAKALGLAVPPGLLAIADEVVE